MSMSRLRAVQFASVCVCDYGVCMALSSEPVLCGVSLLDASLMLNFVFVGEDPHTTWINQSKSPNCRGVSVTSINNGHVGLLMRVQVYVLNIGTV